MKFHDSKNTNFPFELHRSKDKWTEQICVVAKKASVNAIIVSYNR